MAVHFLLVPALLVLVLLLPDGSSTVPAEPFIACIALGGVLGAVGELLYRRHELTSDLLRLVGREVLPHVGIVLCIVGMWAAGERGWFWYSLTVYVLIAVVVMAWSLLKRLRAGHSS